MPVLRSFPLPRIFASFARTPCSHSTPWATARSAATSTVSAIGRNASRSFLGTTAGTAIVVFSGSLLTWPLADLCLGPQIVLLGMKADPSQTGNLLASSIASNVSRDTSSSAEASVVVVSGVPGAGKQLEHIAAHTDRLVVYVSLHEATSPHDLYFATLAGIYSADRLGLLGTLAHSMGVWWIILFDIMVGYEPEKTRAINFSVILQHLKRALRAAHEEQPLSTPRPLVVLDHLREATYHKDDPTMHSMLAHLVKWCAATCYDDGLCDIVLCDETPQTPWRWPGKSQGAKHLSNSQAFKDWLRVQWSM